MSGHSKWAGIKHKKAIVDAQRGKAFTKVVREITVAAKHGGGNPDGNPRLRLAMTKAREVNLPKDRIEQAIKKGTGELPGVSYEEMLFEGYGPGGVAILVEALTDNKNRTSAEVRSIFTKRNGNMAGAGSVSWLFQRKGYILVGASAADEERLLSVVLDRGAEDVVREGESFAITADPQHFEAVKQALADAKIPTESSDLTMIPQNTVRVTGNDATQVLALAEALEEHDDVQHVYANFDIPDEVLKAVAEQ